MASLADVLADSVFAAGALPGSVNATVTPPGGSSVEAVGIWRGNELVGAPSRGRHQTEQVVRAISFRRDQVPAMPRDTLIEAPETEGGTVKSWKVDAPLEYQAKWRTVVVVESD